MHQLKELFTTLTHTTMKALSTNDLARQEFEPKGRNDNYYLAAMLIMAVVLLAVAYYDQIISGITL